MVEGIKLFKRSVYALENRYVKVMKLTEQPKNAPRLEVGGWEIAENRHLA